MENNESKIDLSSVGKVTRPRKKSARQNNADGEVSVTDEMLKAYEKDEYDARVKRIESMPAYLRPAHNAIREQETKKIYCVMTPVMLGNNTVADLFLAFLFKIINRIDIITERETGISIIKSNKASSLGKAFTSLRKAFDCMYGRTDNDETTNPLNKLSDLGDTFAIDEMVSQIFAVMADVCHLHPKDFVIVYPKSIENGKKDYTTAVKEDGMASEWNSHIVSAGIMKTYFGFIETQTYMINPPVLSTNGYIFTEEDEQQES